MLQILGSALAGELLYLAELSYRLLGETRGCSPQTVEGMFIRCRLKVVWPLPESPLWGVRCEQAAGEQLHSSAPSATGFALEGADEQGCGGG